jgi:hypothetical protein
VLASAVRDLPRNGTPTGARAQRWNRDHAWFSAEEMPGWLPASLEPGAGGAVSDTVVARLAGYHLVDNVRGQTIPFAPEETAGSALRSTVIAHDGDLVSLEITGTTRARTDGTWRLGESDWAPAAKHPRSLETRAYGRATWDAAARRFTAFELVALGTRVGRTQYNGRGDDDGPSPIGFSFRLAPPGPAACVPPAFIDIYDAGWVARPRDP